MTNLDQHHQISSLSEQEKEEFIVQTLENHLRRLALGQTNALPRWAIW